MLDLKENIAETTACNIFWIKDNKVYTPKKHSILNGITRQAVLVFMTNILIYKMLYQLFHSY